jgi:hypothetical protein
MAGVPIERVSAEGFTPLICVHLCSSVAINVFFLLLAAEQSYWSPDYALEALVSQTRINFKTNNGRTLLTYNDASRVIAHAAWTPDSQFFVAGTENSAGHQPWAHPIWIYSRAKNEILDLSALGATAVADFTLKSPDVLQTKVLDCKRSKTTPLSSRPLAIDLHDLIATGRLPNPPCPAQ